MAIGIETIIISFGVTCLVSVGSAWIFYAVGFAYGMKYEAQEWVAAFKKITPPNWQSLPIGVGDKDKQIEANKLYVEVFKLAKEMIEKEVAENRISALLENLPDKY